MWPASSSCLPREGQVPCRLLGACLLEEGEVSRSALDCRPGPASASQVGAQGNISEGLI